MYADEPGVRAPIASYQDQLIGGDDFSPMPMMRGGGYVQTTSHYSRGGMGNPTYNSHISTFNYPPMGNSSIPPSDFEEDSHMEGEEYDDAYQ